MSLALSEFWTRLVRSGITDAAGCKQLAAAFIAANDGTPPSDATTLAKFMIRAGVLTEFQARALLADQPQSIRLGNYLLRSDACPPPLSRWAEATRIADGKSGVFLRVSAQQLAGGRAQWLEAHAAIAKQTLQKFESVSESTSTLIFSPLPPGRVLRDVITERGSLSPKKTCQIGIAVADALETLHARPLVHGSVRPDRVWMSKNGEAILLRDPSGPPETPTAVSRDGSAWLDQLDAPEAYAAPEFARREQVCNQSTDLYALGCLLFRLAAGRVPYQRDSMRETVAAHASETPPELAAAIEQGELGDPLYRVIAFAMAKNPAARFATAAQLATALRATLPLLSEAQVSKNAAPKEQQTHRGGSSSAAERPIKKAKAEGTESVKPIVESSSPSARKSKASTEPDPKQTGKRRRTPEPKPTPAKSSPVKSKSTVEVIAGAPQPKVLPTPSPQKPPATASPVELTPDSESSGAIGTESPPAPSTPPSVADSDPGTSPLRQMRRRKKKKTSAPLILGALCVFVLMLLIGLIVHDPGPVEAKKKKRPPIPDVIPPVSNSSVPIPADDSPPVTDSTLVDGYVLVEDDRLLFVPPYAAQSPNAPLEMLPPGAAVIITARLAAIVDSSLGSGLIESLSPELASLIESAAARSAVPVESIERCSIAMHPGKGGWPEVSLAIDLIEPLPSSQLIQRWQVSASRTPEGATIYAGDAIDSDAYYFPASDNRSDSVSRFAVGSIAQISEVAAAEGGATLLPRTLQTLWNGSSDQADLVVLLTPNFLFADGRSLLQSSAPELVRPLKSILIPNVAGALVTAHVVNEQLYVETRIAPSGGVSQSALMRSLRDAIQAWPDWADEFIVESVPDPSWRLLASRLPSMMRYVVDQVRVGISGGSVVANMYLPKQAVPQVTLATLLAMNTRAGGPATAVAPPSQSLTVEEMLSRKMSVSFDQESLEFAIDAIVGDYQRRLPVGSQLPPVRIIGGDLQKMGITQNQQVRDFTKTDLPLRTVLTDLVLGANPDKSATGPKDAKQALIWVLADDPENQGQQAILVTTRQAAENKYDLPEEFRIDP